MWARQHYNAIAKEIRETAQAHNDEYVAEAYKDDLNRMVRLAGLATLQVLAMSLAKRFAADNDRFDPIKFLNSCSYDCDAAPWGELWEN